MTEKFTTTIRSDNDIKIALYYVRNILKNLSFSVVDKQKVIVTVSELTQNILDHTDSIGSITCEAIEDRGIQITVQDWGTGIDSTNDNWDGTKSKKKRGLGLGLEGSKRLMDQFVVESSKGGTKIIAVKWRESPKAKGR